MKRSQAIDILRAVAVILVLGRHMDPCPSNTNRFFAVLSDLWHQGGWVGVDLFFVLSGFLVSGLLFQEHQRFGTISLKSFFIRRGFKIYPAFWALITITVAFKLFGGRVLKVSEVASEVFFLQNYAPPLWGPNWSLAVEEHFYFLLAILLLALSRTRTSNHFGSIPLVFGLTAMVSLLLRLLTTSMLPYHHHTHLFPSHLRMDSLFFGVLLSYFNHYHHRRFVECTQRGRWTFIFIGTLLLLPAFVFPLEQTWFNYTVGLSVFYVGCGLILVGALGLNASRNPAIRFIAFLGAHSYSIYLWHTAVEKWGIPGFVRIFGLHWNWFIYACLYLTSAVVFGIIMARLIELPILRLRDRWFPSKCRPAAGQVTETRHGAIPAPEIAKAI